MLLIAKGPGIYEDQQGAVFVGPSAPYVNDLYIGWAQLWRYADFYLTNAVRCRLPDAAVPVACLKACHEHLEADVRELSRHYAEVVLWLCGAEACQSVLGMTFGQALLAQGTTVEFGGMSVRVFVTYNPAIMYPRRKTSKARPIRNHILLLEAYLRTHELRARLAAEPVTPVTPGTCWPMPDDDIVALDVETHGAIAHGFAEWKSVKREDPPLTEDDLHAGLVRFRNVRDWATDYFEYMPVDMPPQTTFQAALAPHLDGLTPQQTIVTAALAWFEDGELRTALWVVAEREPHRDFIDMLRGLVARGVRITLLGSNLLFDLSWLRAWDPELLGVICESNFDLRDIAVLNFLDDEERPEKSLKAISRLLSVADYSKLPSLKYHRYESPRDPALWSYNVLDAAATLWCARLLSDTITREYGTSKLATASWYSKLMWTILDMHEAGIAYDLRKLRAAEVEFRTQRDALLARMAERGLVARGKGSDGSIRAFVGRCADELGMRVQTTGIVGKVKADKTVLHEYAERAELMDAGCLPMLTTLLEFKRLDKLLSAYITPMLHGTTKNPRQLILNEDRGIGFAHPSWYYSPTEERAGFSKGADYYGGGTRQVRLSAARPGTQTQPPLIYDAMCSRHGAAGFLLKIDSSQLEYRAAAHLSNDAVLIELYADGADLHADAGYELAEWLGIPYADAVRYCGKHCNFLTIYRGQPYKLTLTVLRLLGKKLSRTDATNFIVSRYKRFVGLDQWHRELRAEAVKHGHLTFKLGPLHFTRSFIGGEALVDANFATIVNFKPQVAAACITLDAQIEARRQLLAGGFRTVLVNNRHDEGVYDGPLEERDAVCALLKPIYERPPLIQSVGWRVPLIADITMLQGSDSE